MHSDERRGAAPGRESSSLDGGATAKAQAWCRTGADELPSESTLSRQSRADILGSVDARVATLNGVADGIYARWAQNLRR